MWFVRRLCYSVMEPLQYNIEPFSEATTNLTFKREEQASQLIQYFYKEHYRKRTLSAIVLQKYLSHFLQKQLRKRIECEMRLLHKLRARNDLNCSQLTFKPVQI